MKSVSLIPDEAKAYQLGRTLHIIAKGRADGYSNIRVEQSPAQIFPPLFYVAADESPIIGNFPYTAYGTFEVAPNLEKIFMTTATGNEVPVIQIKNSDLAAAAVEGSLLSKTTDDDVIGISPNDFDVNKAIANAASKLQEKYPANVSATVEETGIVAVGTPVGIAYLYVVMRQNQDKPKAKAKK